MASAIRVIGFSLLSTDHYGRYAEPSGLLLDVGVVAAVFGIVAGSRGNGVTAGGALACAMLLAVRLALGFFLWAEWFAIRAEHGVICGCTRGIVNTAIHGNRITYRALRERIEGGEIQCSDEEKLDVEQAHGVFLECLIERHESGKRRQKFVADCKMRDGLCAAQSTYR